MQHCIDCGAAHPIVTGQISDSMVVSEIGELERFALFLIQSGVLMNVIETSVVDSLY